MSLTVSHCCLLSLTIHSGPWSCYISLTFPHSCFLSQTVSLVLRSCCISLTVYLFFWLYLTESPSAIELLHVSNCLTWLLAVSHCISGLMELLHVSPCLLLLLAVSHCHSKF